MSKKKQNIGFQLRGIEILHILIDLKDKLLAENSEFKFDINLEHKTKVDTKEIMVVCTVSTYTTAKDQLSGQIKVGCVYQFNSLDEYVIKETKELKLPSEIILTLNSSAISTTRGIMYSSFKGTLLHRAILPLIDFQKLTNPNSQ